MVESIKQKVINMRLADCHISGASIASKFNITRQYVALILKDAGLPNAGKPVRYLCNFCGDVIKGDSKLFCSKKCHIYYHNIPVVCDNCGRLFYVPYSQFMARLAKNPDKSWTCCNPCKEEYKVKIFINSL